MSRGLLPATVGPALLLALPRQHHHRPARGRQSRHVQEPLLSLLRQGGSRHHGVPQLPPQLPGEYLRMVLAPDDVLLSQTGGECRWRVSPGHTRRVLLILPRLSLPPDCSASFTVSRSDKGQSSTVFSSCSSTQQPLILTGQSNNLWVEFKSGHKSVSQGFQLTVLSVQGDDDCWQLSIFLLNLSEELGYLVDAIINTGEISTFDTEEKAGNLSQEDKILLSRLLLLLNPSYQAQPLQHKEVLQSNIRQAVLTFRQTDGQTDSFCHLSHERCIKAELSACWLL